VVAGAWTTLLVVAGLVLGFAGAVRSPAARVARATAGIRVVIAGLSLLLPSEAPASIDWTAFSDDALRQARADGRPVLIDFQATWCLPCREMEHTTFRDPTVVEAARSFATLKADVTEQDDGTSELMTRFNVPGVPTYVLLDATGEERRRFVGFVAAPDFREALRAIATGAHRG
jgi:thiol:disulfide interchange protein DsbD